MMSLKWSETKFKYPRGEELFSFTLDFYSFLKFIFAFGSDRIFFLTMIGEEIS